MRFRPNRLKTSESAFGIMGLTCRLLMVGPYEMREPLLSEAFSR